MFTSAVETSVEKANPLLQVVSVLCHHSVSHHLLLPNQTLQLVSSESFKPAGGHDEVFGMSFKISCRTKWGDEFLHSKLRCWKWHSWWRTGRKIKCDHTSYTFYIRMRKSTTNRFYLVHDTYLRCQCCHKLHTCSSSQSTCPPSSAEGLHAFWSGSMYLKTTQVSTENFLYIHYIYVLLQLQDKFIRLSTIFSKGYICKAIYEANLNLQIVKCKTEHTHTHTHQSFY